MRLRLAVPGGKVALHLADPLPTYTGSPGKWLTWQIHEEIDELLSLPRLSETEAARLTYLCDCSAKFLDWMYETNQPRYAGESKSDRAERIRQIRRDATNGGDSIE